VTTGARRTCARGRPLLARRLAATATRRWKTTMLLGACISMTGAGQPKATRGRQAQRAGRQQWPKQGQQRRQPAAAGRQAGTIALQRPRKLITHLDKAAGRLSRSEGPRSALRALPVGRTLACAPFCCCSWHYRRSLQRWHHQAGRSTRAATAVGSLWHVQAWGLLPLCPQPKTPINVCKVTEKTDGVRPWQMVKLAWDSRSGSMPASQGLPNHHPIKGHVDHFAAGPKPNNWCDG